MRNTWGFYYDYMMFVQKQTPPSSTILIPPQSGHWLSTGNAGLSRFFLYPRKLVNGATYDISQSDYDYILISKGSWYSNSVDWGWPKVYVRAEKIWYIDPLTLSVAEVNKNYDPTDEFNKRAWGIIKVRKESSE